MPVSVLLTQILIIFLEIGVGVVGAKCGIINDQSSKFLSNLVMSITLPCTLLASTNISGGREAVFLMLLGFALLICLYLVSTAVCLGISRAIHLTPGQKAVFIGTTVLPNSAFIGIPLATAVLGESVGTVYAAAGIMAYNILFFTYVVRLFQPEQKFSIKSLLTPTNITTVIMVVMLLAGLKLPAPVQGFCSAVGNCTTPLALMIAGVMLAGSKPADLVRRPFLYLITILRCVVFPLAFILILWLLPLDRTLCMGVSILAACPAGSLAAVLARQYDLEGELASQAVAQSTLFIAISVPALLTLAGVLFR
ncbi:MAG: AEC family transporter [Faecousia sp.]